MAVKSVAQLAPQYTCRGTLFLGVATFSFYSLEMKWATYLVHRLLDVLCYDKNLKPFTGSKLYEVCYLSSLFCCISDILVLPWRGDSNYLFPYILMIKRMIRKVV